MGGAHGRKRVAGTAAVVRTGVGSVLAGVLRGWVGVIVVGVALTWCQCALALNPTLDVSQYAHTAWKVREGFTKGVINSIAQTPDGYLWLGTDYGLLRFDGIRTLPWQPPQDQHLPSTFIRSLLAARDGTLWIGTTKGLASWKGGMLTEYPELDGQLIVTLLEDREGRVWASGLGVPTGRLCAIQKGGVQCRGEDGTLGTGVVGLFEDSKGSLWAGARNGLWRWKPVPPKFYPLRVDPEGIQGLTEDYDGTLLIGMQGRIARLVHEKAETAYPFSVPLRQSYARFFLRDHHGVLWIGTSRGLVHIHQGRTDVFTKADGLSGDSVDALFEDREGSVWVATLGGLDRFRDFAVATFSENRGLSIIPGGPVLAASDGSLWLSTFDGLTRWKNGQLTIYSNGSAQARSSAVGTGALGKVLRITGSGLSNLVACLFEDEHGRIWVTTLQGFGYLENDRFVSISTGPRRGGGSITEDTQGNLWIAEQDQGLARLHQGALVEQIPWSKLGHKDPGMALAADPSKSSGLWLGFFQGGVAYYKDGQIRASYTASDGLGAGRVTELRLDPDGTLWAATEGGLSRLKDGRIATLTSKNSLPCDAVYWVMEDDAHGFWLNMACGLVQITRPELDAWAAAVDKDKDKDAKRTIRATVFDSSDGVRILRPTASPLTPYVAKTSDGKLWFTNLDGLGFVDPSHLPFNKLPPPVHIEQITADRKTYDLASYGNELPLPALVRDLEIDYTALSLVAPEKIRFRYKLEGWDRDWQDVGNRRQAFYTGLGPQRYRFRVKACNNDGVWNEAGTFLDFSVAPAYYQTTWFRLSCVAASLALLWGLYQLRLQQLARQFSMRLEERVGERTRIARELHDTLLQSFHGILLRFQIVSNELPAGESKQKLDGAIDQAAKAIIEGRDAVQGLRSSTVESNDVGVAIRTLGEELAAANGPVHATAFRVAVEGTPRNLHPILRDEVYRIAGEGLRNAFRHADAQRIEVEIRYDDRQLRLRVRDDGKGIDPKLLRDEGREGHYGLRGMRERAKLIGGKLTLWSELDSGTEMELNIPAARAYATAPALHRS